MEITLPNTITVPSWIVLGDDIDFVRFLSPDKIEVTYKGTGAKAVAYRNRDGTSWHLLKDRD